MREGGWLSHLGVAPVYLPKERPRSPKLGYIGNTVGRKFSSKPECEASCWLKSGTVARTEFKIPTRQKLVVGLSLKPCTPFHMQPDLRRFLGVELADGLIQKPILRLHGNARCSLMTWSYRMPLH